jgi:hypothetical protein
MADMTKAAAAYRLALDTKATAASMVTKFPRAAAKLEEAAKLLVAEGRKAEVDQK